MVSPDHNELISEFLNVHWDHWQNDKIQTKIQALSHLVITLGKKIDSYICWKVSELYVSGHEIAAVFLPGFAIKW